MNYIKGTHLGNLIDKVFDNLSNRLGSKSKSPKCPVEPKKTTPVEKRAWKETTNKKTEV
jgi:hypothetical protein